MVCCDGEMGILLEESKLSSRVRSQLVRSYGSSETSVPKNRHTTPANTSHGLCRSQDSSPYNTVDENVTCSTSTPSTGTTQAPNTTEPPTEQERIRKRRILPKTQYGGCDKWRVKSIILHRFQIICTEEPTRIPRQHLQRSLPIPRFLSLPHRPKNRFRDTLDLDTLDWSNKGSEHDGTSNDGTSVSDSTTNGVGLAVAQVRDNVARERYATMKKRRTAEMGLDLDTSADFFTPQSSLNVRERGEGSGVVNYLPTRSRNSGNMRNSSGYTSISTNEGSSSNTSSSKQLINDLVWLEKRIADVRARVDLLDEDESSSSTCTPKRSASWTSISRSFGGSPISGNIACCDCVALPRKLQIVIHSTKDGLTIHDVRPGSLLQGQIFSGDLLVAVDDIDTRMFSAKAVMDVMVARSARQRKLTVLHFEEP